ncbi:MAG: hypothetical protein RL745_31 [Actinomycetota bacterium]|jgi:cation diffusion facilitator family transporter
MSLTIALRRERLRQNVPVQQPANDVALQAKDRAAPVDLSKWAVLSIAVGVAVFGMKMWAAWRTGSVGLLSDGLESITNIVAAVVALLALRRAAMPPSRRFHFGQGKAEYFSALVEGALILIAAMFIIVEAVKRLVHPRELESLALGLTITVVASIFNAATAWALLRAGRKHSSLVLQADGKHLLTDVWTSVGVIVGVALVSITGLRQLDPVVGIVVGLNIIYTGIGLMRQSVAGLMDVALPSTDHDVIIDILAKHRSTDIDFHQLQTRAAGRHRFVGFHLLVPGAWSVQQGYDLICTLEQEIEERLPGAVVNIILQPVDDPRAHADQHEGAQPLW